MKRSLLAIAFLLAVGSPPARAAWLVLRDGTSLETRGLWKVADNRVTYRQPDGRQVSVMAVVIDPDATRVANIPGAPPPASASHPPAADPARKKFVINNDLLKKNRVKKPAEERPQMALGTVGDLLKVIAYCASRFNQNQATYESCCLQPLQPPPH